MIIMDRFDKFVADNKEATTNGHTEAMEVIPTKAPPEPTDVTNHTVEKVGHKRKASTPRDEDEFSVGLSDTASTPPKKRKSVVDDDAAFAARLQAEENNRARPTRGGTTRKISIVKKKKKTAARISPNDDSGLSGSETGSKRKINRNSGFHVCPIIMPLLFSPTLINLSYRNSSSSQPPSQRSSTAKHSSPAPKPSNAYGTTSRSANSKIQAIDARSNVTMLYARCSRQIGSICLL